MKILFVHMWMIIGGAETHVFELSRELARRGHDVTVASEGGVLVPELEKAGVKHVRVPLHTKKPTAMLSAYRSLKRLIKEEKYDIVHAHSRIPAFICGMLARRLGFTFVTSTHAVFKVDPLLARISDWGDHTIAVSCDIKQYLIDNYHLPGDNITITINGIDTERFRASAKRDDGGFRVIYVSRIDNETALPGFQLCEAAPALCEKIPSLSIMIVGGGTAFDALKKQADAVNTSLGREVVTLTGPRTDVAELLASADIFVGVSRAALEAMSCERPVVLAGQQGYIGILDEPVLELAKSTNFCCRGEKMPTASLIADDILTLYKMSASGRERLGALGRRVILEGYSVSRMAGDHEAVYKKLAPYRSHRHGDIIISGYYGFDNIGDDSLLAAMIDGIRARRPDVRITVLAKNPRALSRARCVRAINRFNLPMLLREMRHAKLLISGGGSLLQDGTSKKSLLYYVQILRMAKKRGLRVMLYANGLGPLTSPASRKLAAKIIGEADEVSFRESASEQLARELGVTGALRVSADPAFMIDACDDRWRAHLAARESLPERYFIISIKDGSNLDGSRTGAPVIAAMAHDIQKIAKTYDLVPLFVPMYPSRDTAVTESLARACEGAGGRILPNLTATELCALIRGAEFVIGTRLHTLIFAASMCVPHLGISYDPKIDAFLSHISSPPSLDIRTLREGELFAAANALLASAPAIRDSLVDVSARMRSLAESDCDRAVELAR